MPLRASSSRPALLALALAACAPPADPLGSGSVPTPELFAPGVVSTPFEDEVAITFGPDAREAYFTRGGGGRGSPPRRIHVTRFEEGTWTAPEVAEFSTDWDETPFLTADGGRLLFSSRRAVPFEGPTRSNGNLWMVVRSGDDGWSRPMPLPGDVNRPRLEGGRGAPDMSELAPVLLPDGTLLYSTTADAEWASDLYVATGEGDAFVEPRPLLLNTGGAESHPALSPDGRWLVFQGYRDMDGPGEEDLYVAERTDYGWGEPRVLPEPLNSPDGDGYPSFSPDGRFLFFASERSRDGTWSIYYVDAGTLESGVEAKRP